MKNYTEIADNVLLRRDKYFQEKKIKRKKIIKAASLVCCFAVFTGIFFIFNDYIPSIEHTTSPEEVSSTDIGFHGGEGESYADLTDRNKIPDELIINSNFTGEVKYLSGVRIFTAEEESEAERNSENMQYKLSFVEKYMDVAEISDYEIEYGIDDVYPRVIFPDAEITSFLTNISIGSSAFMVLNDSMTDREIISILRENRYTDALFVFLGLNTDNLYIRRETIYFYGEDVENDNPLSKQTAFRIANYSEFPQELSFNLESNYIEFRITENFTENSRTVSTVHGYYVPEECIYQLSDYLTFDEAVIKAAEKDEKFSSDAVTSTVVIYNYDLENRRIMPYYKICYEIDSKTFSVNIPLSKEN